MATDRTDWFPGNAKPVRSGIYERQFNYSKTPIVSYCYYDTRRKEGWSLAASTVDNADQIKWTVAPRQSLPWRGLKEKA